MQAELRLAFRARRPLITVFDDNPHSRAHFDYGAAWARHGDIAEFMGEDLTEDPQRLHPFICGSDHDIV